MKIDSKNSLKMKFCFSKIEIQCTWLVLHKDAMIIMLTKIYQLYYTCTKKIKGLGLVVCKWTKHL